jgi:hypothetical protein
VDAHTDLLYIAEQARGILVERNLFDGSDAIGGANVGSVVQDQTMGTGTAGNHVFRNNRFVHDGSGHMFNFDRAPGTTPDACADPVIFESNVFNWVNDGVNGDTLFNTNTTGGKDCPGLSARAGTVCTSNTFADGSAAKCSVNGR